MKTKITSILNTNAQNWAAVSPRLVLGVVMVAHGAQKLFGWFGGYGLEASSNFFANQLGLTPGIFWAALAGGGEFFGGLLLIIGLATRFAALTVGITMAVATFTVHAGGFFAPEGMEYTLTLLAVSIALLISGGGALSFDARFSKKN